MPNELKQRLRICKENLDFESTKEIPDFEKVRDEAGYAMGYARDLNFGLAKGNYQKGSAEFPSIIEMFEKIEESLLCILNTEAIPTQEEKNIKEFRYCTRQRIQSIKGRMVRIQQYEELNGFSPLDDLLSDEED